MRGAPLRVKFLDRNTKHTDWYWNFGDGKASRSQNPLHIYKIPGKYPVKLTVKSAGSTEQFLVATS
jgi:PKD repeat protein